MDSFFEDSPHCTDADYLAQSPPYPRTPAQAHLALLTCIKYMRLHFSSAFDLANGLVNGAGKIIPSAVTLDCVFIDGRRALVGIDTYVENLGSFMQTPAFTALPVTTQLKAAALLTGLVALRTELDQDKFLNGPSGSTKCSVLGQLGRVFHAMQDFYAHSNHSDTKGPGPISISNPPGLGLRAPAPLLNMLSSTGAPAPFNFPAGQNPKVPAGLSTACFDLIDLGNCKGRMDHDKSIGKDTGTIEYQLVYQPLLYQDTKITTSNPGTPRGEIGRGNGNNFYKAVIGAAEQTTTTWTQFGAALIARYGVTRGTQMICALTHDDPVRDCTAGGTKAISPPSTTTSTSTTTTTSTSTTTTTSTSTTTPPATTTTSPATTTTSPTTTSPTYTYQVTDTGKGTAVIVPSQTVGLCTYSFAGSLSTSWTFVFDARFTVARGDDATAYPVGNGNATSISGITSADVTASSTPGCGYSPTATCSYSIPLSLNQLTFQWATAYKPGTVQISPVVGWKISAQIPGPGVCNGSEGSYSLANGLRGSGGGDLVGQGTCSAAGFDIPISHLGQPQIVATTAAAPPDLSCQASPFPPRYSPKVQQTVTLHLLNANE